MIKLTKVACSQTNAPALFLLPGGPGLSSLTLRSLDFLNRSFDLLYVDFPGTNENPYAGKKDFSELSSLLNKEILKVPGSKYILGHSYGGFFAAQAFTDLDLNGLVCVSTPFSEVALSEAAENYFAQRDGSLLKAETEWNANQNDSTFAEWLSEYGSLYFKKASGKSLLLSDKVSAQFFLDNRSDLSALKLLPLLAKTSRKKVFISGSEDKLLSPEVTKADAKLGHFDFFEVQNASHFVTFDQPEKTAEIIEISLLI